MLNNYMFEFQTLLLSQVTNDFFLKLPMCGCAICYVDLIANFYSQNLEHYMLCFYGIYPCALIEAGNVKQRGTCNHKLDISSQ